MTKRAPDPFRPEEVPEGRSFAKIGRSETAVVVTCLILAVAIGLIVWATLF